MFIIQAWTLIPLKVLGVFLVGWKGIYNSIVMFGYFVGIVERLVGKDWMIGMNH